jgi:cell migration-inducing and hyaluronan-binding protein
MDLHVLELDAGNWVIVEIPGFTKAASGAPQNSLDALRKASVTSYYKGPDALWVKLVSPGDDERAGHGGGEQLQVSR